MNNYPEKIECPHPEDRIINHGLEICSFCPDRAFCGDDRVKVIFK